MKPDQEPAVSEPARPRIQFSWVLLGVVFFAGMFLGVTFKEFIVLMFGALVQGLLVGRR